MSKDVNTTMNTKVTMEKVMETISSYIAAADSKKAQKMLTRLQNELMAPDYEEKMFAEQVWVKEDVVNALQRKGFSGSDLQVQILMTDARTTLDEIKEYSLKQLDLLVDGKTATMMSVN